MMPISEAAMSHLVSRDGEFDAKRYGRVRLWGSLGFFITVMLAGVWFEYFGIQHFPAWTVVTLAAVVVCVWSLPNLKEEIDASAPQTLKRTVWPVLKQPLVLWLFAGVFFHVLAHMAVYFFLSLYLDALGYSKTVIGLLWGVSVLVEIVWFFTQSRWLPWLPLSSWLCVAALLTFIRMGLTAAGADYWPVLLLAQLLHAVTFAAHHSVCIHLISQHFPAALRGRGQALYSLIAYGLTGVVGGLAGGALIEHLGLASIFWGAMGSAFLAICCTYKLMKHVRPKQS
jgi:PPP family 3-phenylpropionic acid transporter